MAAVRRCGGHDVLLHLHTPMYYKVKTDYVEVLILYTLVLHHNQFSHIYFITYIVTRICGDQNFTLAT